MADLRRVNKRNPCPICGRDHWCYFIGQDTVVCMRVPSDRPKRAKGYGGYIHHLNGNYKLPDVLPVSDVPRGDLNTLDETYRALLRQPEFGLSFEDYRKFQEWGLPVQFIKGRGYRRMPLAGRADICRRLLEEGYVLEGVPGFYCKEGRYGAYWTFTTGPGLIFPSLSSEGKIQGFQVRLDNPRRKIKYKWFSSSGLPGGASSGSPWHVARPSRVRCRGIVITEGFRKADVVAEYMGVVTIGVSGVNNIEGVAEYVNGKKMPVIIAYDMDLLKNRAVFEALRALVGELKGDVYVAAWNRKYKGLDDLLVSGGWPRVIPVGQALKRIKQALTYFRG